MELLVTLLIDGRAQPLLLPDQVALSEEGGLSATVEPAGIIIIREIAEAMQVRDSTLQKHFQNIFRKLDVSSRWEIMRLLLEGDPRS